MRTRIELRVGRNAPCPCGSGKKFKRCCFTRENFHAIAQSGQFVDDSKFLPNDVPMETLSGVVISNDGNEARIEVHDDTAVFHRGPETLEQWHEEYAIGKVVRVERFAWANVQEVQ